MDGKIVYGQKDLEKALTEGEKNIILCAGIYTLPVCADTSFSRLGPVKADVLCSREAAAAEGMIFDGIEPVFHPRYAIDSDEPMTVMSVTALSASGGSGSRGSRYYLISSFGSGYFSSGSFGSGSGGRYYEYEFEFEHGRGGSFSNSFALSYSYSGSYGGSYPIGSAVGRSELLPAPFELPERFIRVFGYGINLI